MELLRSVAELAPRWYWNFCVVFGLSFSVAIAVVAGPLFAIFPLMAVPVTAVLSWIRPEGTPPHKAFKLWMAWMILVGAGWVIYLLLVLLGLVEP